MEPLPAISPLKERGAGTSAFAAGVRMRGTPATIVLLVVNLAMYGVELALGAPDSTPALARLGALMRDRVLAGEVWRVVTSTFLHGSVPHLAFNMLVLFGLGRSLERILGTSRFVLLYSAAAIGGSVVSLVFMGQFSVGASGALWGLMTAQMVLALRGRGILPEDLRARMQAGAMQNLALNVMNSLRPGVDWAAHAGGGIVGGLLGLVGLLTLGLPRWASVKPGEEAPPDRVPAFVNALAVLGGLTLAVGLGAGLVLGGAFALGRPPQLRPTAIGATGFTADLPDVLAPNAGDPTSRDQAFGDLSLDPALVEIIVQSPDALLTPEDREQLYTEIDEALASKADGFTRRGSNPRMDRVEVDGVVVLEGEYDGPNGFQLERAIVVREDAIVRVEEIYPAGGDASWHGLARVIALSARGPGVGR